jgi:hypothetical protein
LPQAGKNKIDIVNFKWNCYTKIRIYKEENMPVKIESVTKKSPSEKAGLKAGMMLC